MIVGAHYLGQGRCQFAVWAPLRAAVSIEIIEPEPRQIALTAEPEGYWTATADQVPSWRSIPNSAGRGSDPTRPGVSLPTPGSSWPFPGD